MCVVCGCGEPGGHEPTTVLHYGTGAARASVPGLGATRLVQIEADVLGANQRFADRNRAHFAAHGVHAINLLSSPGSGKTTLLCATIAALQQRKPRLPLAVIEGDQQTELDAERIRCAGAPAIQVNTGRGCHLDARMVGEAFERLALHAHGDEHDDTQGHGDVERARGHAHHHAHDDGHAPRRGPGRDPGPRHGRGHDPGAAHDPGPARAAAASLLFIENVGNLVCPALWDLGEAAKVVILSVTEGEDKPLKYPDMFAAADLLLLNKTDLLPHVDFDVARCIEHARRIRPQLPVLQLSATRGDGLDAWLDWLLSPSTAQHAR